MNKPLLTSELKWKKELDHLKGRLALEEKEAALCDYLYGRLNIVDGKASALLTFNGIFLAVAAVVLTKDFSDKLKLDVTHCPLLLALVAIIWLISSVFCLLVSLLRWERLDETASNKETYKETMAAVTIRRTAFYNSAAYLTLLDIALMIIILFL